ncbi:MAG TPA: helix-turn-helix domain-containing protein [Sphingomonas sp.]|nr:helix-turn-helix domain-containing protein [Sphingomonas sp.]
MTDTPREDSTLFPASAGDRLREAREKQKLSIADIAQRTRVPIRHLEAIEQGDYDELPSPTYAIGFAKAYARAVDADEVEIGGLVRTEAGVPRRPTLESLPYEPADPARLPPAGIAILGVLIALVLVIGAGIWLGTDLFRGGAGPAAPAASPTPVAAAPATPPPAPRVEQVTLTATDAVWLRVYDADNNTLFQKTMQAGERYQVPLDARNPMINVGRPDKLEVRLGDTLQPPLGDGSRALKDIGVGAAAVKARQQTAAENTPSTPRAPAP